jgi:hypothetical protein
VSTPQSVVLIFVAAFAWIGLTLLVVLEMRRRRRGSSRVASALPPPHPTSDSDRPHRAWRRARPVTNQAPSRRRRRLRIKKAPG